MWDCIFSISGSVLDYIQGQMKKIRVKDDLPYHESEDW